MISHTTVRDLAHRGFPLLSPPAPICVRKRVSFRSPVCHGASESRNFSHSSKATVGWCTPPAGPRMLCRSTCCAVSWPTPCLNLWLRRSFPRESRS